jgi:hypothetical protein
MPGQYYVNAPLAIAPYGVLTGPARVSLNLLTGTNLPARLPRITADSSFSGNALVQIQSQAPGGWSVPAAGHSLKGLFLDGSALSSGSVNGILFTGPVYDTTSKTCSSISSMTASTRPDTPKAASLPPTRTGRDR